jgi:hypothetical protein
MYKKTTTVQPESVSLDAADESGRGATLPVVKDG